MGQERIMVILEEHKERTQREYATLSSELKTWSEVCTCYEMEPFFLTIYLKCGGRQFWLMQSLFEEKVCYMEESIHIALARPLLMEVLR
jgi:hypothetical protein